MASLTDEQEWHLRQVMKRRKKQILAAVVRTYFTAHRPSALRNSTLHSFIFDETHLLPMVGNFLITNSSEESNNNDQGRIISPSESSPNESAITEEQRRIWSWRRMKESQFDEFLSMNRDDIEWRSTLGMSRLAFQQFCIVMRDTLQKLDTRFGTTIPLEKRIAIALRKLASGDSYTVTGNFFGVPKSTVHRTTRELVTALVANRARWINALSNADCTNLLEHFRRLGNIPNVAGIIGSFKIELASSGNQQPTVIASQLVCDKNFRIIELLVDDDLLDKNANLSEAAIHKFENSDFFHRAERGDLLARPFVRINGSETYLRPILVASSTEYPLRSWLLAPFELATSPEKRELNASIAQLAGGVVSHTSTLLTKRWQILTKKLENAPEYVTQTLVACAVLHNFLVEQHDFDSELADTTASPTPATMNLARDPIVSEINEQYELTLSPEKMRNAIATSICS